MQFMQIIFKPLIRCSKSSTIRLQQLYSTNKLPSESNSLQSTFIPTKACDEMGRTSKDMIKFFSLVSKKYASGNQKLNI